jgi:hypothetical protein
MKRENKQRQIQGSFALLRMTLQGVRAVGLEIEARVLGEVSVKVAAMKCRG